MTAASLTQEEVLTAVAYLQAVWEEDTAAIELLERTDDPERGILDLVIDLADAVGQLYLIARLGIRDDMDEAERVAANERVDADPAARVTAVLIDAYRQWAKTAQGPAARELALSVIGYLAMSGAATREEVPQIFALIRSGFFLPGQSAGG